MLRYDPPFRGHYRHVVTDTTLRGVDLERGVPPGAALGSATATSHFECQ